MRTVWQERHDEKKRNRTTPTLAERLNGEALYGLNPVREALRVGRRELHHLWVQEGSDAADASLLDAAARLNLAVERVSKHDLNMLTEPPDRTTASSSTPARWHHPRTRSRPDRE